MIIQCNEYIYKELFIMKLDKTALDRLLSLDDSTLSKTILSLASAAGIDGIAASAAASNLRLVRQSLSNATDADIEKAMGMLGEKRADALKKALGDADER